ncbi:hypothetical protein BJX65DRAFT_287486 [Aspergillus insuetus]
MLSFFWLLFQANHPKKPSWSPTPLNPLLPTFSRSSPLQDPPARHPLPIVTGTFVNRSLARPEAQPGPACVDLDCKKNQCKHARNNQGGYTRQKQPSRVAGMCAASKENQWPRGHHEIKWRRSPKALTVLFSYYSFFFFSGFSIFSKFQTLETLAPSQLSLFNLSCLVVGPVPLSYSRIRADDGKLIWRVVTSVLFGLDCWELTRTC